MKDSEDKTGATVRHSLISATLERATVAITSTHDDVECVIVGKVVKVSKTYATVATSRANESPIPLAAITEVRRIDASEKPVTPTEAA